MHMSSSAQSMSGAFNPFTFKVGIEMYEPITFFLIVWGLFYVL